jgi:hypothetical protein
VAAVTATFPSVAIATPVRAFFETAGASGGVLAAFERSCYLETDQGQLIAVLGEPLGRGAFALTVGDLPPFTTLHPGDPVSVEEQVLRLGSIRVDLRTAALWDPTLPPLAGPAEEGMGILAAHLRAHAPAEGLSRLLVEAAGVPPAPLLDRGRRALDRLGAGIARGNARTITEAVTDLAGLGPGLTPSGDDVLAGTLLALHLWPDVAGPLGPRVVAALILGTAARRTGRISRAYLWAARQGHAAEAWHDLVRALPANPDGVISAAGRILATGETSGADMLTGFLFALTR